MDVATLDPGDRPGAGPERTVRGDGNLRTQETSPGVWIVDHYSTLTNAISRNPYAGAGGVVIMIGFRCVY